MAHVRGIARTIELIKWIILGLNKMLCILCLCCRVPIIPCLLFLCGPPRRLSNMEREETIECIEGVDDSSYILLLIWDIIPISSQIAYNTHWFCYIRESLEYLRKGDSLSHPCLKKLQYSIFSATVTITWRGYPNKFNVRHTEKRLKDYFARVI